MSYLRSLSTFVETGSRHNKKFNNLISEQKLSANHSYPPIENNVKFGTHNKNVINLSSQDLSKDTISALSRGLNYAPAPLKIPVENIIANVEDAIFRNKIPHRDAECMRQDISSILRKSKPPKRNMSRSELSALKDLRKNKDILVLPADKGNATVVVDTTTYQQKVNEIVSDTNTYKKVNYNPTARIATKVTKMLRDADNETIVPRLLPHNPTAPKIYGLPKIHKPDWPLRPIVSQIDAPTYNLSKYMAEVLQPFTGNTNSYVKDSRHFVRLLSDIQVEPNEIMVSFDVTSLFTNVPVDDAVDVISKLIQESNLSTEYIEWTAYCLKSGYFVWQGEFYLQIDGVAMGSPIAPVVANLFMEWFENEALLAAPQKPRYWWRYVDDVFAIIDKDSLRGFSSYLNTRHKKIQFTVEEEQHNSLPFLDVRVIRKPDGTLDHTVYRKPTHTDRYLRADSHHHMSHLASVSRALIDRALNLCGPEYVQAEMDHIRLVLEHNGYRWAQCVRWANPGSSNRPDTVQRSPTYLPYIKGVTDKIGYHLRRKYNIKTVYRPPGQLRRLLRSPKDKDLLGGPGVYKIPCDCGKSYIGETRRNINTRVLEHIRSVKNMDTIRSAVAEHACITDSRHFLRFDKVSVLAREKFFVPRKIREAIEISRNPNFNRDRGWAVPTAWGPALTPYLHNTGAWSGETDTVSAVCVRGPSECDSDSSSDKTSDDALEDVVPRSMAAPAPPSSRELRAAARSARRDLSA